MSETTAPAKTEEKKRSPLAQLFTDNWPVIKTVIPKHLTPERMARIAFSVISRNRDLGMCSPVSLANAVIEASMLGLEIGGPLGQAHLLPFNNKHTGGKDAQLVIGYKGFRELAYRSGHVTSFPAHAVFPGDTFEYCYGAKQTLEHRPAERERGKQLSHVYAVAFHRGELLDFEVLTREACLRTKAKAPGAKKSDSPWNDTRGDEDGPGFIAMCCKTAVRRLASRLPMSPDLQRAAALDEYAEAGVPQGLAHIIDVQPGAAADLNAKVFDQDRPQDSQATQPTTRPCPNRLHEDTGEQMAVLVGVCDTCKDRAECPSWKE